MNIATPMSKRSKHLWLLPVGSFLFFLFAMDHNVSVYDESLILVGATKVLHGAVPHRDFYANYGPAQFYVLAGLFKIFGPSVLVERMWDAVTRAGITTVSFLLLERISCRRDAYVGAIVVLAWLVGLATYAFPIFPALLSSLIAALLLSHAADSHRPHHLLFGAGVGAGISVLFRYDAGFYAVIALTTALLLKAALYPRLGVRSWISEFISDAFRFLSGVAAICMPVAIAFASAGALPDLFFDVLAWPMQWYARMRGLPFPTPDTFVGFLAAAQVLYVPAVAWIAGFAAIVFGRKNDLSKSGRGWTLLLLCSLSMFFYLKGLVRVSPIHMGMSIIPALLVVAGSIQYYVGRARRAVRVIVLAVLIYFVTYDLSTHVSAGSDWLYGPAMSSSAQSAALGSCTSVSTPRLRCFATDPQRLEAVLYVREHTSDDEPIYVGLNRHDKIFVNDMLFYFLADRSPVSKWYHFDPGLQTTEKIQREMIAELKRSRPSIIVLESEWDQSLEPNESSKSSGVVILDQFISDNYGLAKSFGTISILKGNWI